jgi:hypothetical protein
MLFDQDPGRQRLNVVIVKNRYGGLKHDRPIIEIQGDQMHRGAGNADAVIEGLPLCVESRERRQQRRVDIECPIRKRVEERSRHTSHETGQADQIDPALPEHFRKGVIVRLLTDVRFRIHPLRLDAGIAGTFETGGITSIRDDDANRRVETAVSSCADDGLEVAAAARNQDGKTRP